MSLLNEGSYGCIYYPGLTCKLKKSKKKKIVSKIQLNDMTSKNELEIGKLLEKENIKGLRGIKSSCVIKKHLEKLSNCSIIKKKSELIKLDMEYVNGTDFSYFITDSNYKNTYIECLTLLKKLNNLNIVHFDIKENNILYNIDNKHLYIIDFGLSINIDKLKKENNYKNYFFKYTSYDSWCIDIIIMNYVINKKKLIKTKKEVEKIVKKFMESPFLKKCSKNFKELYYEECLKYTSLFIDKSIPYIKKNLIKNWKTWDIYSIGIIFIENCKKLNILDKKFIEILFETIHPNPIKRLNYNEILKKMKNI
jgi:tRNA A-37 threonylcarbamoyl transferase component Bud32